MKKMNEALTCFDDAIRFSSNTINIDNNNDNNNNNNNDNIVTTPTIYYHERAKARQVSGDYSNALADFNIVLTRQPHNYHALVNRSLVLKELHDYRASARDWQRATALDTQNLLCRWRVQDLHELHYITFTAPGEEQMQNEDENVNGKYTDTYNSTINSNNGNNS